MEGSANRPKNIAHRGASSIAPENTLAAFREAIRLGADGFELDAQLAKDDQVVVIHDGSLLRTTRSIGRVASKTLKELHELDAGAWFNLRHPRYASPDFIGERIPTLSEVMELIRDRPLCLYIEMKFARDSRPGIEEKIAQLINDFSLHDRAVVISFNHQAIKTVKRLDRRIRTGALFQRTLKYPVISRSRLLMLAEAAEADELALDKTLVTRPLLKAVRAAGYDIAVWTVNNPLMMRRMIKLGVSAIMTNYPQRLRSLQDRLNRATQDW